LKNNNELFVNKLWNFRAIVKQEPFCEAEIEPTGSSRKAGLVTLHTARLIQPRRTAMLVAMEHREKLNRYCLLRKIRQEQAVNEWIGEALQKLDADPVMGEKLKRAEQLQRELDTLLQPLKTQAAGV
jgi:hypothetical protein